MERESEGSVRGELKGMKKQLAVLLLNVGVANPSQAAMTRKVRKKVAEERKKKEAEDTRLKTVAEFLRKEKGRLAEEERQAQRLEEATRSEEVCETAQAQREIVAARTEVKAVTARAASLETAVGAMKVAAERRQKRLRRRLKRRGGRWRHHLRARSG